MQRRPGRTVEPFCRSEGSSTPDDEQGPVAGFARTLMGLDWPPESPPGELATSLVRRSLLGLGRCSIVSASGALTTCTHAGPRGLSLGRGPVWWPRTGSPLLAFGLPSRVPVVRKPSMTGPQSDRVSNCLPCGSFPSDVFLEAGSHHSRASSPGSCSLPSVSRALEVLLRPSPAGLVSCRSRPWGFPRRGSVDGSLEPASSPAEVVPPDDRGPACAGRRSLATALWSASKSEAKRS